jgi:membrane protein YdbS with pleckstrin-like domain
MMNEMMGGATGWMMTSMGALWLLVLVVLVLAVAALARYVFFK